MRDWFNEFSTMLQREIDGAKYISQQPGAPADSEFAAWLHAATTCMRRVEDLTREKFDGVDVAEAEAKERAKA